MIYTTGGLRVARVSVIDGSGKEVLDELVQMDDGVQVMYAFLYNAGQCSLSPIAVIIILAFLALPRKTMQQPQWTWWLSGKFYTTSLIQIQSLLVTGWKTI